MFEKSRNFFLQNYLSKRKVISKAIKRVTKKVNKKTAKKVIDKLINKLMSKVTNKVIKRSIKKAINKIIKKEKIISSENILIENSHLDSTNKALVLEGDAKNLYTSKLSPLDKSLHLEEAKPPHQSSLNIFIVTSILSGFIFWASVTPIDEVAVVAGQIIPAGFIKSVQHLEGGIISELYVKEGQKVGEGDLLIRLDGKGFSSDLDQALSKQLSLRIKEERLRAIGLSREPAFDSYGPEHEQLIEDQRAIYEMQKRNLNDQKAILEKQIEQQKDQLETQIDQETDIRNRLKFVEKQRDIVKQLYETRLKTGTEYRNTEENVTVVQKEHNEVLNQMQKTKEGILEAEKRLVEVDTRVRSDALKEMGTTAAELEEVTATINKLRDRVSRLDIYAPNSGIVKGLKVTNLMAVIQPGEEIMQIVPGNALEIEAKLNPKDAGNVKPGQKVTVKVEAYDYARYGSVSGILKSVSASTFLTEDKRPYYKAFIALKQYYVGSDSKKNQLSPGMTITADIHTGSKTLLQYLIRPVYNAYKSAFRER